MERREFIESLLTGTGTVLIMAPALVSCEKDDDNLPTLPDEGLIIDLTQQSNSPLLNPGGHVYRSNLIVANAGNEVFIALSSTCTHEGCTVGFSLEPLKFPCPCHGSEFSSTGSVLTGPANSPLRRYVVTKEENTLTIKNA